MSMIMASRGFCLPSQATIHELFSVARDAGIVPDISLDPVLPSFFSLDSSASVQHQYTSIQRSMTEEQRTAFRYNLTSTLGGSGGGGGGGGGRVTHGGVGVVALALSILFDQVAEQVRSRGSSMGGSSVHGSQPRMIFGIRSSSRIGEIIQSYLGQIPEIANNQDKMAETTELYDNLLKLEMIDHFERMTNKKKRMGSESMKQWLVGAAVHLHIRIHQVRLNSVPRGSAESLRLSYKTGFSRLMQGYTTYLRRNIQETAPTATPGPATRRAGGRRQASASRSNMTGFKNTTLSKTTYTTDPTRRLVDVSPIRPNNTSGRLSQTNTTAPTARTIRTLRSSGSSEATGPTWPKGSDKTTVGLVRNETIIAGAPSVSSVDSRKRKTASQGLLVIEPLRNVSHSVQHHPCQSPAIEQALVTRIIDTQDLERSRDFFLHSEKLFSSLLRQSNDFELKTQRQ
ncbi:uncharacterized protein LOC130110325 [Lampris incognitus]|uniref:uncharacterized protein LOC130110325 n=1 Tax=Lampris incognitus TaxID=2546036 RepID=UPI0024B4D2A5|nr:uncharacterized protein LOC130110325 [Lampris incognitus]